MSTGAIQPFHPVASVTVVSSTVSANAPLQGSGGTILVTNLSSSLVYVSFGSDNTIQATNGDMPVLPNSKVLLSIGNLVSYAAALLISGSGSVLFTRGTGSVI